MQSIDLNHIILVKTALGRKEISARSTSVTALERRVLILADGVRTLEHLQIMLNALLLGLALNLESKGLVDAFSMPLLDRPLDGLSNQDAINRVAANDAQPVCAPTTPGMLTHRSPASPGLLSAKAYLAEVAESMLTDRTGVMARKISAIETESDTYHVFELLMTKLSGQSSQSEIRAMMRRFDEEISKR
jgi:hypothetical protein